MWTIPSIHLCPNFSEYLDKLNQKADKEKNKSGEPRKFVELVDKNNSSVNGSRDNCILSEFMQMRDAKFSKVTNDHQHHHNHHHDQRSDANANVMNDNESQGRRGSLQGQRWSSTVSNPRLSKSSSNYSIKTVNSNPGETLTFDRKGLSSLSSKLLSPLNYYM